MTAVKMTGPGTCIECGAESDRKAKGLCGRCYRRDLSRRSPACSINECLRPTLARGWCDVHLSRWYRHGDPHLGASRAGQGYVNTAGYVQIGIKGHPLASAKGDVYYHRVVLYDRIGPGPHGCHWCGTLLDWTASETVDRLIGDHVDGDRLNNDPSNIVPSCHSCNVARSLRGMWWSRPLGVLA